MAASSQVIAQASASAVLTGASASSPSAPSPALGSKTRPASAMSPHLPFWEYLYQNPQLIAAGVASAAAVLVGVITLAGVVLSLRAATRRMRKELSAAASLGQLNREHSRTDANLDREQSRQQASLDRQHEADEAKKQRLIEVRKQVYLKWADDLGEVQQLLATLPTVNTEVTPDFMAPLRNFAASINNTWLVSELQTTMATRELNAKLMELFGQLVKRCSDIWDMQRRHRRLLETKTTAVAEHDRLIDALNQNLHFNGDDEKVRDGLGQALKLQVERIVETEGKLDNLVAQIDPVMAQYRQTLMAGLAPTLLDIEAVITSAREEMGMVGGNEAIRQQTREMYQRMLRMVDDAESR